MKKSFLLLILVLASASAFGQAFGKNAMFGEVGFGLGIQHYRFTDVTNNTSDPRDTSAAIEVPLRFEYGLTKWLGVSLDGNFASYITGDSAKDESAKGFDILPAVNIHAPFGLNKLDLYANVGYGYSHFKYTVTGPGGGNAIAGGTIFNWGFHLRWLFRTDGHLGMNFWYTHSTYNYNHGTITNNAGNTSKFKIDGPGNNFGIGIFYRIPR